MSRVRLTRTTVIEYELYPECYPTGWTAEQMAEYDAADDNDVRDEMFMNNIVSDKVAYEVLEDGDEK